MKTNLRTTTTYLLIAAVAIGCVLFFMYRNVRQSLIDDELNRLGAIADIKAQMIDTYFDTIKADSAVASDNMDVKTNLPIIERYASDQQNPAYLQAKKTLDAQLQIWHTLKNGISDVVLTNASGTVVYTVNQRDAEHEIGNPLSDPNGLAFSEGEKGLYVGDLFLNKPDGGIISFYASAPVYDPQNNFVGVIAFESSPSELYQLIDTTAGLGTTGETLIGRLESSSSTHNRVLYLNPLRTDPGAAFDFSIPIGAAVGQPLQMAVMGANGSGIATDYSGDQVLAVWHYMPERQWGLVAKIDTSEVLGPINYLGMLLILLGMCVAIIAGTVIYFLSKKRSDNFQLAVDNSSEQIMITDPEGIMLYVNPATEKITGYSVKELLNKKAGVPWHSPMPKTFYQNFWKTIKTDKKPFVGELQNRRKNGELYDVQLKVSPVLDKKGDILYFVGIERDITEEKRVARAKDDFMSLASHQLRTPPSIISWYVETLQSGELGPINTKQTEYLGEVYKANQRMVAIINALLNISRIEMDTFGVSPKKIDIKSLVDETAKELESRFQRKITLEGDYGANTDSFAADPNILQIIIDNLLSNAFKYSPPEDTRIHVSAKLEGGALTLSVKDNGIGITTKDQDRVFEKLFRADNAVSANPDGTGIGLYMTKKIVDGLGGTIWFDSKEGKGSTFYVSFPATGMKEKTGDTVLARSTNTPAS